MTGKKIKNTWCPGCSNFTILAALKNTLSSLNEKEKIVITAGIGCGSKIIDYLDFNTFSALHGRPVASAEGIKLANPKLKVIASIGDGGAYNEGISHLIHGAKRNIDITVLVHNNRNFALTTSQFTAVSPENFKGRSTPRGSIEEPFNPLELMLVSGASFVARGYAFKTDQLQELIKKGINHKGFSFIDILQPCITFFDQTDFYNERVYQLEEKDLTSRKKALEKIREWNYENGDSKIPLGVFYQKEKESYGEKLFRKI